jgi:ubiquinone biosynthesis protein
MVGTLDAATREALVRIVLALAAGDTDRLVDELTALGMTGETVARGPLKQDLERLRRRYATRPLKEIAAAEAFHEIMDVARRHRLRLPAELVQLAKVIAMAEGTALQLDPDFEILAFALPYVRRFWLRTLAPRAQARRLSGALVDLSDLSEALPRQLRRLSRRLEQGDLPLTIVADPSPEALRRLERAANRVAFSVLAAAFIVGGSLLALAYHPTGGHPAFVAVLALAVVLVLGLVAALWHRGRL